MLCLAAGFHPLPLGTASLSWETTAAALVASAAHAQAAAGAAAGGAQPVVTQQRAQFRTRVRISLQATADQILKKEIAFKKLQQIGLFLWSILYPLPRRNSKEMHTLL